MKRNIIIVVIAAVSALFLSVSCKKNDNLEFSTEEKIFKATIDQSLTKTTLDDGLKVNWESGDQININGAVYTATPLGVSSSADFTRVNGNEPSPVFHAIYPSNLFKTPFNYEFPAIQEYSSVCFNAPMYAESSSESLLFKNICGVLCFSLRGTDKVKRISVIANEALCGSFTMNGDAVNLTGTGNIITLDCGPTGVQLSSSNPTKFYIYLPPKVYSAGMKIIITNTEEYVFEKVTTKEATIAASNLYSFNWDINSFIPALTGEFSVAENKKISFAQGNLHAAKIGENWKFGFYDGQLGFNSISVMGGSRTANEADNDIDLLTWGYGNFSTSPTTKEYVSQASGNLSQTDDWGSQIGNGDKWRTLTSAEWNYMLFSRENAQKLCKNCVTVCGVSGCLVIAPDNFKESIATSYDKAAWLQAEKNDGLVCLPPAGQRIGVGINGPGKLGFYWTSTANGETSADVLSLSNAGQGIQVLEEVCNNIATKKMNGWGDGFSISQDKIQEVDCYKISHTPKESEYDAQIQYSNNSFKTTSYTLAIKARVSSGTYAMNQLFQVKDGGQCKLSTFNLTEEWHDFEVTFTNELDNCSILTFNIGDYNGDIYIAYVSLKEAQSTIEERILQGFPNGEGFSWGPQGTFSNSQDFASEKYCHIMNNTLAGDPSSAKYQINCSAGTFQAGQKYRIRMTAKSDPTLTDRKWQLMKVGDGDGDGDGYVDCYVDCGQFDKLNFTNDWADLVSDGYCTTDGATSISFELGDFVGTIWLAQVSVYKLVNVPNANQSGVGTIANDRKYGLSVRLVRDVAPKGDITSLVDNTDFGDLFN